MTLKYKPRLQNNKQHNIATNNDIDDNAPQDLEEEQLLVSCLLHRLPGGPPAARLAALEVARARLERGGPRRARLTLPALCFCGLEVRLGGWPAACSPSFSSFPTSLPCHAKQP